MMIVKNMSDELREYRKLCIAIKQLYSYSKLEWKSAIKERPKKLTQAIEGYEIIEDKFITIEKIKLYRLVNEHNKEPCIVTKRPLVLPPLEKYDVKYIPMVTFDCDFRNPLPSVRYGLKLLEIFQEEDNERIRFFEFRYELAHGGPHHDFPHAQISRVGENKNFNWIPEHVPAFPLCANGAMSLLLCIIISLYSKRKSGNIVNHLKIDEIYKTPIKQIVS